MANPAGTYYGYLADRVSDGVRLLKFSGAGRFCVAIMVGQDEGEVGPGYPAFTLDSSGAIILNSDRNDDSYSTTNPECAIRVDGESLSLDVTLPPLTEVKGFVVHRDGSMCDAWLDAWKGSGDGQEAYLTASTASLGTARGFTFYLTPGKWRLSAIDDQDEYGPSVPDTKLTVGASPIHDVQVTCGGTGLDE